jgi:hypothetical protein
MQLPRGTFREIKKNQNTGDLLKELERVRFSGICSISYRDDVSTLVLKSGRCILAEYDTVKGDAALEGLLHAIADRNIDAALSTLDEAQIQLSLEFNNAEQIKKIGRALPAFQKPVHQPVNPAHRIIIKKTGLTPGTNFSPSGEKLSTPAARLPKIKAGSQTAPKNPLNDPPVLNIAATAPVPEERKIPARDTTPTGSESDLDLLDSMNLDQMTDKIRDDCRTVVKQLHLDHLMDRD